jgi:hypothetical protein
MPLIIDSSKFYEDPSTFKDVQQIKGKYMSFDDVIWGIGIFPLMSDLFPGTFHVIL